MRNSYQNRHQIHLVTDPKQVRVDLARATRAALQGGVNWVQLRQKGGPALKLYEDTAEIIPLATQFEAGVSINDRVDVALASSADGVHLAAKSLPPAAARALMPGGMVLGISVHSLKEAQAAVDAGVDYVTFGHVYPTSSKLGLPPRGVRELAEIVESVDVPVLAIGGINTTNIREVLATGAAGIAVISTILEAENPESAARELRLGMDSSAIRPRHPFPQKIKGGR